ncbi:MAG: hypothetical protein ACE5G0_04065 [Rhodothermales bacterium]
MADTVKRSSLLTALVDPFRPTTDRAEQPYRFTASRRAWFAPLGLGIALLVASAVGWNLESEQFYFSYLIGWVFCLSLALGALFLVMIKHLTKAYWVVAVRRIPEALLWSFPLLIVLFIPIFFGMNDLFHWTEHGIDDPTSEHFDEILAGKTAYLNVPFFLIRMAFYFLIWMYLSYRLYTLSIRQDVDPDPNIPALQRRVSAWGLPLVAVTSAFASFDLLMSLDPHWFSTIFGVYFFGGAFLAALSFIALATILLHRGGMLHNIITKDHLQDLGKLMFGFVVFWAYIAFSQYMLYWYGSIPEETVWFRHRLEHGWEMYSAILLIFHFILPFAILLPRAPKRSIPLMSIMTVWLLVMHWFDLYWIAMPVLHAEHATGIHWLDVTCWLGLFFLFIGVFVWRLSRHALVPQRDPLLAKSLRFENA